MAAGTEVMEGMNVRVVDTDAPSYCSRSPQAVLRSAEVEKKGSIL